jgi:hypothetical protein
MLDFIKRRLKSEKGAMDKILVTLLLIIIGIGAVVGLGSWMGSMTDDIKSDANSTVQTIKTNN